MSAEFIEVDTSPGGEPSGSPCTFSEFSVSNVTQDCHFRDSRDTFNRSAFRSGIRTTDGDLR